MDTTELDELLNEQDTNAQVQEINIEDIRPNPYQPRKVFDEDNLQELADSIKQDGVFQPIILRKSSVIGYEIIAGERRFRASKLAGKTTVPAIIRSMSDEQMMEVAVLENLQREDLTPLEEAKAYDSLMNNLNLTQDQLSKRLGKSRPYIANYLRLLGLPIEVKNMLNVGQLSMGQARTLLGLKDETLIVALAQRTIEENLTVRQLENMVNEINSTTHRVVKNPRSKRLSPYLRQSQNILEEKFGTKVAIKTNLHNNKGKIEIDYTSQDDLMRILDILDVKLD